MIPEFRRNSLSPSPGENDNERERFQKFEINSEIMQVINRQFSHAEIAINNMIICTKIHPRTSQKGPEVE